MGNFFSQQEHPPYSQGYQSQAYPPNYQHQQGYQAQPYSPNYQQQQPYYESPERMPKQQPYPPQEPYPPRQPSRRPERRLSKKYSRIGDNYTSVEEVQKALRGGGLESSNLIVGIDFTKSNEWTGKHSFGGRSLHAIGAVPNPYEQALSIIGRTLSPFDEDNLIPCFGFGDASTHDQDVFSFYPDNRPCNGFEDALNRYRAIVPHLRLSGPTSFGPIIEAAIDIVEESGGQYHVLLIIADGQVTRSVDTEPGRLSPQEQRTMDAIVAASDYALSIVLVGVGDGPWDMMKEFDDNIPARAFDNFQFVNFSEMMSRKVPQANKEALFSLAALMEIPSQYKATLELNILGCRRGSKPRKSPLPPPAGVLQATSARGYGFQESTSAKGYGFQESTSAKGYGFQESSQRAMGPRPSAPEANSDAQICQICLVERKDLAYGCGHQTCRGCGEHLTTCPFCRQEISTRIRLY